MMSLVNYLSACRRLKEYDKFIKLNGEDSLPDQLLAQKDMIILEKEYYKEEFINHTIWFSAFALFCWAVYFILNYGDYLR